MPGGTDGTRLGHSLSEPTPPPVRALGQQVEAVGAAERVGVLRTGIRGDAFRLCRIEGILRREEGFGPIPGGT